MASTYKTPGAYVEEISKFPPSIAPVATAIPAFIGYTEKATKDLPGDLLGKPTRISALADYDRYFGGAFKEINFKAAVEDRIDASGILRRNVSVIRPPVMSDFMLYYSIQLYFNNGGGPCYIIAVDTYRDAGGQVNTIDPDKVGTNAGGTGGLDLLEMEDEPTLILFPDAQALSPAKYFSLCGAALAQCNKLQDRFSIFDTKGTDETAPAVFRNFIGTNYLKYGAVYYPFLETAYTYAYQEEDVVINHVPETTFALIVQAVDAINPEIVKITNAQVAIDGQDAVVLANAVTGAGTKATKIAALAPVKASADALKAQVDAVSAALQTIITEAIDVNKPFQDPDIITVSSSIADALTATSNYAIKLTETSAKVTDAETRHTADPTTITNNEIDAIATNFSAQVGAVGAALPNLKDDIAKLKNTTLPALLNAIRGNSPTNIIPEVDAAFATAVSARAVLAAVQFQSMIDGVITAPNTTQAVASLQNNIGTTITASITNLDAIATALSTIQGAVENIAEIAFLQNLAATVDAVDTTSLAVIRALLKTLSTRIANATNAMTQADLSKLATSFGETMQALTNELEQTFITLENLRNAVTYLDINTKKLSEIKNIDNTTYNQIKAEIEKISVILPPSPAIAGVYARVDRDRGVWKAPANVSLDSVIRPIQKITNDTQDGLNVDTIAGKSVNAIRSFTGKGTLVWGARTLAGNDNEWRFVSVRRFFNYAEESIKKASEGFVFEANDANTWVKIKAMIENFLTLEWRGGALAGAKTSDAFFVKVGLGETMTPIDILEGRMNIEVGMAVVRPAEFIILKFSHLMQES